MCKTYGNGAEVKEAGALINMVTKSGGNEFHGRYSEAYMRQPGGNITPELEARGLSVGTSLQYFNDASADLGGRIIRDKVWFYGVVPRSAQPDDASGLGAEPRARRQSISPATSRRRSRSRR